MEKCDWIIGIIGAEIVHFSRYNNKKDFYMTRFNMMKKTGKKLRSQTGASITFALLLFMVCAVVASIVVTASTVVSGRFAELENRDRNYYAVTSAAELVRDMMDGQTVTFKQTKDTTTVTVIDPTGSGSGDPTETVTVDTKVKVGGSYYTTDDSGNVPLLEYATTLLTFGESANWTTEDAWNLTYDGAQNSHTWKYTIAPEVPGNSTDKNEQLSVAVTATLVGDTLTYTFSNKVDDPSSNFSVRLICTPGIATPKNVTVKSRTSNSSTDATGKVTLTMTEQLEQDVTVTWSKEGCVIER